MTQHEEEIYMDGIKKGMEIQKEIAKKYLSWAGDRIKRDGKELNKLRKKVRKSLSRTAWTASDDQLLVDLHRKGLTNKELAERFPGRSPLAINYRLNVKHNLHQNREVEEKKTGDYAGLANLGQQLED